MCESLNHYKRLHLVNMLITINVYSHFKTFMPNQTVLLLMVHRFLDKSYVSSLKPML
jgi:hypothetical protein